MGVVRQETRNEGRNLHEWDYISLSEKRVVCVLIKQRSKIDGNYYAKTSANDVLSHDGNTIFSEPIICVYADQDNLIETSELSPGQYVIVNKIMYGYSTSDIAEIMCIPPSSVCIQFNRAQDKIVKRNNELWNSTYCKNGCVK